jgi:hypothetical protein
MAIAVPRELKAARLSATKSNSILWLASGPACDPDAGHRIKTRTRRPCSNRLAVQAVFSQFPLGRRFSSPILAAPILLLKASHMMRAIRDGVCVNRRVYRAVSEDAGTLQVYSADLGGEFARIRVDSSPRNRTKFSLLAFDERSFLLLGGDGPAVATFEVWHFDVVDRVWTEFVSADAARVKRRSDHCAAIVRSQAVPCVYVFGGSDGLFPAADMLVLSISERQFRHAALPFGPQWPCPRYSATLTVCRNHVRLFGGFAENGEILSDLWQFDTFLFEKYQKWQRLTSPSAPPGRHAHQAWTSGESYFVAGGVNAKAAPVNDIWEYSDGRWRPIKVFAAVNPILVCDLGLVETGNALTLVEQKPLCADLDCQFENLRIKTADYSNRAIRTSEELQILRARLDRLKQWNAEIKAGKTDNSEERLCAIIKEAESDVSESQKALHALAHRLFADYPLCSTKRRTEKIGNRGLALQLWISLEKLRNKLRAEGDEEQAVVSMLSQEVDELESQGLDSDIGDISTFEKFVLRLKVEQAKLPSVLGSYYGMQLREYEQLNARLERMRKQIEKVRTATPLYEGTIRRLSPKLRKRFLQVQKLEEDLERWRKYAESAQRQLATAEEYEGFVRDLVAKKVGSDLVFPDPPELVRDFSPAEADALRKADALARELCASVKGSSEDQAKLLIAGPIQGICEALARIDWT